MNTFQEGDKVVLKPLSERIAFSKLEHDTVYEIEKVYHSGVCKIKHRPDNEELQLIADLVHLEDYDGVIKDKKWDDNKPMVGMMKTYFPNALMGVSEVVKYGYTKYSTPWLYKEISNAEQRYEDALGRHDLLSRIEDYDEESGLLHLAHRAWNALATLEMAMDQGKKIRRED